MQPLEPIAPPAGTDASLVVGVGEREPELHGQRFSGWAIAQHQRITRLEALLPRGRRDISFIPAPDRTDGVLWTISIPEAVGAEVTLLATTEAGRLLSGRLHVARDVPEPDPENAEHAQRDAVLERFRAAIQKDKLEVLELGGRDLAEETAIWRRYFRGASRYISADIHPGPGVDVVADAHRLSETMGLATVDAIFSVATLEHLAMPWIAAREMNRVLRPGGLVHVTTHQTWPLHELPNDFWRFTPASMRVLFGGMNGFEVLECGMNGRVSITYRRPDPAELNMAIAPAYASIYVLARKVADVDSLPAEPGARELAELSRLYPPPTNSR